MIYAIMHILQWNQVKSKILAFIIVWKGQFEAKKVKPNKEDLWCDVCLSLFTYLFLFQLYLIYLIVECWIISETEHKSKWGSNLQSCIRIMTRIKMRIKSGSGPGSKSGSNQDQDQDQKEDHIKSAASQVQQPPSSVCWLAQFCKRKRLWNKTNPSEQGLQFVQTPVFGQTRFLASQHSQLC